MISLLTSNSIHIVSREVSGVKTIMSKPRSRILPLWNMLLTITPIKTIRSPNSTPYLNINDETLYVTLPP